MRSSDSQETVKRSKSWSYIKPSMTVLNSEKMHSE